LGLLNKEEFLGHPSNQGVKTRQNSIRLDDWIGEDNPVRVIDVHMTSTLRPASRSSRRLD